MTKRAKDGISSILVPILYGIMAIAIAMLVCWSGRYPFGSETMNHIYLGEQVYEGIKEGHFITLYDSQWYNGIELFRNVAPLPSYVLALCQTVAGGDSIEGYLVFVGSIFFVSAMTWYLMGKKRDRLALGIVLGAIWFFMPNNLYVMFFEGNLAQALCMIFIPFLVSGMYDYLNEGKWFRLIKVIMAFAGIALCDLDYMLMTGIGLIVFLLIYGLICHQWKRIGHLIIAVVIGFFIVSVWAIPAITAGNGAGIAIEDMNHYFQSIIKSINPVERIKSANKYYYFGIASFILAIFGILCGKKKTAPGFLFAIIILLSTAASMYHVLKLIPGKEYFMMCQYISLALCFVLYALLMWNTLKKGILVLVCVLLVVDVVPSLNLVYGNLSGISVDQRFASQNETTMIGAAKKVCQQRMALLDGSELEAMGAYLVSGYKEASASSLGGEWAFSETGSNLSQVNRALTNGFYEYLFDRCKELGNDTVLLKVSQLNTSPVPEALIDGAAAMAGYELVKTNEFYRLYDMNIDGNWGVLSDYPAIGIGTGAPIISLGFPAVEEVVSPKLDDYTLEELSQYKVVYLSGFTYDNKETAEELIIRLSEAGTRVIIMADGIPEDSSSHTRDFLGIVCNDISFSNGYPLLDTKLGVLDCDYFPAGNEEWNTVYVNGLDDVWGTVEENDMKLDFYGTVKNDNIIVVGLNLTYYYSITQDEGIGALLSDIMGMEMNLLPKREIVPLKVTYDAEGITIMSEEDNVNTTLAYHDMFTGQLNIATKNNLLYVNAGVTRIGFSYPYLIVGVIVNVFAIGAMVLFLYIVRKKEMNK